MIADVRNALYDRGLFKSHDLGERTISIGNIAMGGTGKTPLVAHVAEILAGAGDKVCILTRGYGRKSSGRVLVSDGERVLVDASTGGDEPVELARKLIGKAIVVADADRVAASAWAREEFGVSAFILDDGFQHRRAIRDLDIVCIDATQPFGSVLRESKTNLARADAIVITRSDLISVVDDPLDELRSLAPDAQIFKSVTKLKTKGGPAEENVFPFCGIGNPRSFFTMLTRQGFEIPAQRVFADHHVYSQSDITEIEAEAKSHRCEILVTTAKDAVKLDGLKFEMPLLVAEIEVVIDDPDQFRLLVTSA